MRVNLKAREESTKETLIRVSIRDTIRIRKKKKDRVR